MIQETLLNLLRSGHIINLVGIPSHLGSMGNEQADKEAKESPRLEQLDDIKNLSLKIPAAGCRKRWI